MSRHSNGIAVSEVPKLSSYREKRAQSKHIATSNTDSKLIEELEESLKGNMRRRGLSQHNPASQPQLLRLNVEQPELQQPQESSSKLMGKYGSNGNNIAEVIEQYPDQALKTTPDSTARKTDKKRVVPGLKPLEKELAQVTSHKVLKQNEALNTPKKTGLKMFKPQTPVNQFPSKTDRRPTGQGINVTQVVRSNDNGKLIRKVQQLEEEVSRAVTAEQQRQLRIYFEAITELLRQPTE